MDTQVQRAVSERQRGSPKLAQPCFLGLCLGKKGASVHAQNSDCQRAANADEEGLGHSVQQDRGAQEGIFQGKLKLQT